MNKTNRIRGYETSDCCTSKDVQSIYQRRLKYKSMKKRVEVEEAAAGLTVGTAKRTTLNSLSKKRLQLLELE